MAMFQPNANPETENFRKKKSGGSSSANATGKKKTESKGKKMDFNKQNGDWTDRNQRIHSI